MRQGPIPKLELILRRAAIIGFSGEEGTALLAAGADVNHVDRWGSTVLMAAARNGHTEIVAALLAAGADVNYVDHQGNTALIAAARNGYTEVVTVLLAAGADVNYVHEDGGETALMAAARINRNNHPAIVNELITNTALSQRNNGADWQIMTSDNQGQPSQLSNHQVQNLLTQETATLLAIILPKEDLRNSIVENFNQRNADNPLDQGRESKITKLRTLRSTLEERFLHSINPSAAASASSSVANTRARNQAELLALIAVTNILTNPSQLTNFRNYLESNGADGELSRLTENTADLTAQELFYNPRLDASQNLIVRRTLGELIVEPLRRVRRDRAVGASASFAATEAPPPPQSVTVLTQEDVRNARIRRFAVGASSATASAAATRTTTPSTTTQAAEVKVSSDARDATRTNTNVQATDQSAAVSAIASSAATRTAPSTTTEVAEAEVSGDTRDAAIASESAVTVAPPPPPTPRTTVTTTGAGTATQAVPPTGCCVVS